MDETPAKPDQPTAVKKPRRRWHQFGLRSLLIGVAILAVPCAYVGSQAKIVRQRQSLADEENARHGLVRLEDDDAQLPAIRRWLGDHAYQLFVLAEHDQEAVERYRKAFSEANIFPQAVIPPPPD